MDSLEKRILDFIKASNEPLETKEIESGIKATRTMTLYRLQNLRGEGLIKGKQVGASKGAWIWWIK